MECTYRYNETLASSSRNLYCQIEFPLLPLSGHWTGKQVWIFQCNDVNFNTRILLHQSVGGLRDHTNIMKVHYILNTFRTKKLPLTISRINVIHGNQTCRRNIKAVKGIANVTQAKGEVPQHLFSICLYK
jgi:hypothetical protein